MLILGSVKPEKWYSVKEVSEVLGVSRDTVIRQIHAGHLKAFILPGRSSRRRRVYRCYRVQGAEIFRFIEENFGRVRAA